MEEKENANAFTIIATIKRLAKKFFKLQPQ